MYEWRIDLFGRLADVIADVENCDMPKCVSMEIQPQVLKSRLVPDGKGGQTTEVLKSKLAMVPVEHLPSQQDMVDFERARRMALMELHDIELPYAAVTARYVANPPPSGGYTLELKVSAYETLDTPEADGGALQAR